MDAPKPAKIRKEEDVKITAFAVLHSENKQNHMSDDYQTEQVVLRRGFDALMTFQLSDELDPDRHSLAIHFNCGTRPSYSRHTHFVSRIGVKPTRSYHWSGSVVLTERTSVEVAVKIPVDAPVGEYKVEGEITTGSKSDTFEGERSVAILFNPWHEDDSVYIKDEEERQEYVLNETGLIWAGAYNNMFTWPWNFGQFEAYSLNVALYLMDLKDLSAEERRSPVVVSRIMAEMVNFNDDDGGILWGQWSGEYSDGVSPTSWSGSAAILEQFWRTKEVVKYAQCWVFGGTLTSMLRCVGIPSRPITNFASAHDTDANRSIDFYYKGNKKLDNLSADSIWNYHVWVEAWMERSDLKGHYGGWQALDATPQELSGHSDTYTLGPAPLAAIKEGQDKKYDSEFVIAEVNADIRYHVQQKDGSFKVAGSNERRVGKYISTKAVGDEYRVDITDNYKYPEGSVEERASLESGLETKSDVEMVLKPADDVMVGNPLKASLFLKSDSSEKRSLDITVIISAVTYVGALGSEIKTLNIKETLDPKSSKEIPFSVAPNDYLPFVADQLLVNIGVFAVEAVTDFNFVLKETFRFKTPDVDVTLGDGSTSKIPPGQVTQCSATFSNPLSVDLTQVVWYIEGSGLLNPRTISGSDISVGASGSISFEISPTEGHSKYRYVIVTCDSRELLAIMGKARVHVTH